MMSLDIPRIKLTILDRLYAENFSQQQSHLEKAQQVYQNTLAVAAVNTYLQCLGWDTSLESSDSRDFLLQTFLDTADLEIPHYGKIECRPVKPSQEVMIIPEEAAHQRVAYIAVEIEESTNQAKILGFTSKIESTTIPLNRLRAIADLPEYLEQYHRTSVSIEEIEDKKPVLPKLSNWLSGVIECGWQTLDDLLATQPNLEFLNPNPNQRNLSFRSPTSSTSIADSISKETLTIGTSRVKLWNIGKSQNTDIALIITLSLGKRDQLEISFKVCPTNENDYLPPGLLIQILDETEQPVLQAYIKSANEAVEFFLSGETGELFTIQTIFEDEIKTESFMI